MDIQKIVDAVKTAPANEQIGVLKAAIDCQFGTDSIEAHESNSFWQGAAAIKAEADTVPASGRKQLYADVADAMIEQLDADTSWMENNLIDFKNQLSDFPENGAATDLGDTPIE